MKVMTTEEVAKLLQIEERTLRRWVGKGMIPGSKTPAGWRFTEADVQAFLDKYRHAGNDKPIDDEIDNPHEGDDHE